MKRLGRSAMLMAAAVIIALGVGGCAAKAEFEAGQAAERTGDTDKAAKHYENAVREAERSTWGKAAAKRLQAIKEAKAAAAEAAHQKRVKEAEKIVDFHYGGSGYHAEKCFEKDLHPWVCGHKDRKKRAYDECELVRLDRKCEVYSGTAYCCPFGAKLY